MFTFHPKFKIIIKKIQDLIDEVNFEVKLNLKNGVDVFSLSELKNKIKTPIKKSNKIRIHFYKSHILQLETDGRIGYSNVFRSSMINFKRSTNNTDKSFIAFSKADFQNYEEFLLRNIKYETTISMYIRTFVEVFP